MGMLWGPHPIQAVVARFRAIAHVAYDWWNLFVRGAEPTQPREAITSRRLLLSAVGRLTESGDQLRGVLTRTHTALPRRVPFIRDLHLPFQPKYQSGVADKALPAAIQNAERRLAPKRRCARKSSHLPKKLFPTGNIGILHQPSSRQLPPATLRNGIPLTLDRIYQRFDRGRGTVGRQISDQNIGEIGRQNRIVVVLLAENAWIVLKVDYRLIRQHRRNYYGWVVACRLNQRPCPGRHQS